jgi:hypothetical protein
MGESVGWDSDEDIKYELQAAHLYDDKNVDKVAEEENKGGDGKTD